MKRKVIEKSKVQTVIRYETDSQWAIHETRNRITSPTFSLVNRQDSSELCVCGHYDFERVIPIENGIGAVSFKDNNCGKIWYVINEDGNILASSFSRVQFPKRIKDIYNDKIIVTSQYGKKHLYRIFNKTGLIAELNSSEKLDSYLETLKFPMNKTL